MCKKTLHTETLPACCSGPAETTTISSLQLQSGKEHSDPELAVEVDDRVDVDDHRDHNGGYYHMGMSQNEVPLSWLKRFTLRREKGTSF